MLAQGISICFLLFNLPYAFLIGLVVILGFGTATVYPTFLNAIAQNTNPQNRAESSGVFRLWRDLGYAVGALLSSLISDLFGISYAILTVGLITIISAFVIQVRYPKDR